MKSLQWDAHVGCISCEKQERYSESVCGNQIKVAFCKTETDTKYWNESLVSRLRGSGHQDIIYTVLDMAQ
jgi:tRNA splicing ligase